MQGYIKLFRKFTDWEWYNNINVKIVFLHLLLIANHKEKQWQGIKIDKGQVLTSLEHLSKEVGLTVQQTRTALTKLKSTYEITSKSTNKYTLITLVNWGKYQLDKEKITSEITSKLTNEQQTNNKQITTNKNDKNEKNIKENNKKKSYGEFDNVLLTDEEYAKLDKSNLLSYIEILSSYIASKGKKYKSHYATILSWSRRDKVKEKDDYAEYIRV